MSQQRSQEGRGWGWGRAGRVLGREGPPGRWRQELEKLGHVSSGGQPLPSSLQRLPSLKAWASLISAGGRLRPHIHPHTTAWLLVLLPSPPTGQGLRNGDSAQKVVKQRGTHVSGAVHLPHWRPQAALLLVGDPSWAEDKELIRWCLGVER